MIPDGEAVGLNSFLVTLTLAAITSLYLFFWPSCRDGVDYAQPGRDHYEISLDNLYCSYYRSNDIPGVVRFIVRTGTTAYASSVPRGVRQVLTLPVLDLRNHRLLRQRGTLVVRNGQRISHSVYRIGDGKNFQSNICIENSA